MQIIPTRLRAHLPHTTESSTSKPYVGSHHSDAATQVATRISQKSSMLPSSQNDIKQMPSFQSNTAPFPILLDSELELLKTAKIQTQLQLMQAQSELNHMMEDKNHTPPASIDVDKCFLYALHQEKLATQQNGGIGRIYQTVLDEEIEVQHEQISKKINHVRYSDKQKLETEFSAIYTDKSKQRAEIWNSSSIAPRDKEVALSSIDNNFKSKIQSFSLKKDERMKIIDNTYTENRRKIPSKNDPNKISLVENSLLDIKNGEIAFLKHKLAMLDYSQKTSEIYKKSVWNPSEKLINQLNKKRNSTNERMETYTTDELIKISQIIGDIKSKSKTVTSKKTEKAIFKFIPIYTPVYLYSKKIGKDSFNKSLKNAQKDLEEYKQSASKSGYNLNLNLKKINQLLIDKLLLQAQNNRLCDKNVDTQISVLDDLPMMSSIRGIDPKSGLYHETQFDNSGTCLLHAVNHYIAGYSTQNDSVFLAFTPRRLELTLNAIYQQKQAELCENLSSALISKKENKYFSDIFKDQETGIKALNSKYALHQSSYVADYNYDKNQTMLTNNITEKIGTSDLAHTGIINALMSNIYSLNEDVAIKKTASKWESQINKMEKLQNTHNQLRMHYSPSNRDTGHAMNFSKTNGQWYFQDSHFDAPIPCTPTEMIKHLNRLDTNNSPLSNISFSGQNVSFRQHHEIDETTTISFFHYS